MERLMPKTGKEDNDNKPVKNCSFCHKKGHNEKECWKKNGPPVNQV